MSATRLLVLIPARSGSKGFPGKNLALLGGFSLLERAVLCARAFHREVAGEADVRIYVDTDDELYAAAARAAGGEAPFLREPAFATDSTTTASSVGRFISRLQERDGWRPTHICILQPTSPLRSAQQVLSCWRRWHELGSSALVSVERSSRTPPMAYAEGAPGLLAAYGAVEASTTLRQLRPPALYADGAVYLVTLEAFLRSNRFVLSSETGFVELDYLTGIDIDQPSDLEHAALLLAGQSAIRPVGRVEVGAARPDDIQATLAGLRESIAVEPWQARLNVDSAVLYANGISASSISRLRPVRLGVWCESRAAFISALPYVGGAEILMLEATCGAEPDLIATLQTKFQK